MGDSQTLFNPVKNGVARKLATLVSRVRARSSGRRCRDIQPLSLVPNPRLEVEAFP
jgi:hypothetical protein